MFSYLWKPRFAAGRQPPLELAGARVYQRRMTDPVAFSILGRPVYWYGILVALGFLAAVTHWNRLAKRFGLPEGIGSDLGLIVILGGILGARIAYVLSNAGYFAQHPAEIVRIDQGGLIFYGGFLLSTACVIVMARIRKLPLWPLGDFAISALPLGHAFGRFGCLLNGCCYGAISNVPWAVETAGAMRHPVQLYETIFNLALYAGLHVTLRRSQTPGMTVAAYLIGYGTWRFLIEFLRGDPRTPFLLGLNTSQGLSLTLVAAGIALLWFRRARAASAR